MGQLQSGLSEAGTQDDVAYSPEAVGYTHPHRSSRSTKIFYASHGGQKRSLVGPIRRGVGKKMHQYPPPSPSIDQEGREDSIDLLRQVVASTLGTPDMHSEEQGRFVIGDASTLPTVLITSEESKKDDNHIPAQETIIEETESMMPESSRLGCTELPSLATDVERDYNQPFANGPDLGLIMASRRPSGISLTRVLTDEDDRQMIMAYWQQSGSDTPMLRRHSLSETEGIKTAKETGRASPYRPVPGRWTSSWEVGRATPGERSIQGEGSVTPSKFYRKPVPDAQQEVVFNDRDMISSPATFREKQQYFLWPAKVSLDKSNRDESDEIMSRASVSSDALHSHVEALREGPRYVVDPTASDLMRSTDDILKSSYSSSSPAAAPVPMGRPRKASLLNKLTQRVLKNSEPTIVSAPVNIATSQPSTTMGKKSGGIAVRESWTSSDGPWEAHIVNMESKKMSPVRGFAQPVKQRSFDMLRKETISSSSALIKAVDGADDSDMIEWAPVPFAETAVQASLAALKALEAEEGTDLKSIWKRERLLGSANLSSTNDPSAVRVEPSISQLSRYSRSRRVAPYPPSDHSSSMEGKRKHRKAQEMSTKKEKKGRVSSASQTEEQSVFLAFTSDSDRAYHGHHKTQAPALRNASREAKSTADIVKDVASGAIASSSPALAKQFQEEAELDAEVAKVVGHLPSPNHEKCTKEVGGGGVTGKQRDVDDVQAWRKHPLFEFVGSEKESNQVGSYKAKEVKKPVDRLRREPTPQMKSPALPRQSKIRKGYGCDDIKAWQASLRIASAPIATLME